MIVLFQVFRHAAYWKINHYSTIHPHPPTHTQWQNIIHYYMSLSYTNMRLAHQIGFTSEWISTSDKEMPDYAIIPRLSSAHVILCACGIFGVALWQLPLHRRQKQVAPAHKQPPLVTLSHLGGTKSLTVITRVIFQYLTSGKREVCRQSTLTTEENHSIITHSASHVVLINLNIINK